MNNYIPSGTSLFDILSMIIPGGLIIAFIADLGNLTVSYATECSYSFIFYALYFVLSYLVGLIWNSLMDISFRWFRNNKYAIYLAKQSLKKSCTICRFRSLKRAFDKDPHNIVNHYINAYYKVAKESIGNVIIILETQVAFIRNMILIISGYGIYLLFNNQFIAGLFECRSNFSIGISLIILSVLLFFVMISRQQKIYYLIWEGEQYISDK